MSEVGFEQMLAEYNEAFKEAVSYSNIMPDDGKYLISIVKFEDGTKDGVPWWKLTGRVEDPQDAQWGGHEFQVGFYNPKTFGFMKDTAKGLAGRSVADLRDALAVLNASPGTVANAKVITTTSKKDKKEYTNCYILDVIDEVQPPPVEDVQTGQYEGNADNSAVGPTTDEE